MNDLVSQIGRHGAGLVAAICFLEAIGFPLPAAVAMLVGGALVALGKVTALALFVAVIGAFVSGDMIMYMVGRNTGWWLLGTLCRLSANPESCIVTAAQNFYRRGRAVLLFCKFVPGLNTMAGPLAGSMRMPLVEFLGLDAAGILIYGSFYCTAGYLFSDLLTAILEVMGNAGRVAEVIVAGALAGFVGYRFWRAWKSRSADTVPRIAVHDLVGQLHCDDVMVADVRSHGYYDPGTKRIKGSVRLEPNALPDAAANLPRDKKIFLYCT